MGLDGTLDAFSLPEIVHLLSFTRKSGALHVSRGVGSGQRHGVVFVREGAVTNASGDTSRQLLARRLIGAGHLDDESVGLLVRHLAEQAGGRVAVAVAVRASGAVDPDVLTQVAHEQAVDGVFDLLRWTEGRFSFAVDEPDPDDVGLRVPLDEAVAEARSRLESWDQMAREIPSDDVVPALASEPPDDLALTRDEWALVSLVDGRRTVRELVALSGRGEYAMVAALVAMVRRGLLVVPDGGQAAAGVAALVRRQRMIEALEGGAEDVPAEATDERPEDATAERPGAATEDAADKPADNAADKPADDAADKAAEGGTVRHVADDTPSAGGTPSASRPAVNRAVVLRVIAGVRGL